MCRFLNFLKHSVCLISTLLVLGVMQDAHALASPQKSRLDNRIQYINYNPDNVFKINAVNGFITTIVFSAEETVSTFGSGYSTAWEFESADNQFFLKPKDKDASTNLVIVTNKHVYSFDILLVEQAKDATYKLTFRYPEQDRLKANLAKEKLEAQREKERLEQMLRAPDPNINTNPGLKNFFYTMNFGETADSKLLAPATVFDDGLFTYFKFKVNTDFPSVYSVSADGESIVNSHIEKDTLIVHGVYPEFRLRAGNNVVGVYNETYTKRLNSVTYRNASTLHNGTSVQGVARQIKGSANE